MKESLTTFIEDDGPMLAICGGYQLLGQYYIGAHGERIEGIHALSHHTESRSTIVSSVTLRLKTKKPAKHTMVSKTTTD